MAIMSPSLEALGTAIQDARHVEAGELFCQLLRDGHPVKDLIAYCMEIEAPYVHVPSHIIEREAELAGVQYDHTILGLRAGWRVVPRMPAKFELLPWAQAIWYMPQGMDICGQLIGTFPGHYARQKGYDVNGEKRRDPELYFPDVYEPIREGTLDERLRAVFKLTVDGDRVRAWQYFLGLIDDAIADPSLQPVIRHHVLYAALVDKEESCVGQAMTSQQGHKALRTRSMFDLADWFGWANAHPAFYTGFPDLPTSPRYYQMYDLASSLIKREFKEDAAALHERNTAPLSDAEIDALIAVIHGDDRWAVASKITELLKAGRAIQSIADAIFMASAEYMLTLENPKAYFLPYHGYDYCNVATSWLRDGLDRNSAKVLYIMAQSVHAAAQHVRGFERAESYQIVPLPIPDSWTDQRGCGEIFEAIVGRDDVRATGLTASYLAEHRDHQSLIGALSHAAGIYEGDPHVMRDAASSIEEYERNSTGRQERILLYWSKYLSHAQKRTLEQNCYQTYRRYLVDRE